MKQTAAFLCRWALLFFLTSVLVFVLVRMMPVTPEEQWLTTYKLPHSEENLAYVREQMGLNKPLPVQYVRWITRFLSGDWGLSLVSRVDIRSQFVRKLPPSLSIGLLGTLLGAGTGLALGYGAAFRRRGVCDRLSSFLSVFSQSVPAFLLSLLIIHLLSVQLKAVRFFTGDGRYALLTAILLTALYAAGALSRVVRNACREEMDKTYVKFAVSMGFPKRKVLRSYALKPVLCKLTAAVSASFAWVFGGSAILEFAFGIPGISYFLIDSMKARDYNVLQTYILVVVIWMFLVHLVLGLLLRALDARGRT